VRVLTSDEVDSIGRWAAESAYGADVLPLVYSHQELLQLLADADAALANPIVADLEAVRARIHKAMSKED
jgi:hypothetical protein